MALYPGDKKALGIVGAAVVAALVIIAAATTALVWNSDVDHTPTVSVESDGTWARLTPQAWCTEQLTECTPASFNPIETDLLSPAADDPVLDEPARFIVPVDDALRLIPPAELSRSGLPWDLMAVYATPDGLQEVATRYWSDQRVITLESTTERTLVAVTIYAYAAVVNPEGTDAILVPRGQIAIATAPDGFTIPRPDVMLPPVEQSVT